MKLLETSKFKKLRKKLRSSHEKEALKQAILQALDNPFEGKLLKGEFKDLRSLRYDVQGQSRRLVYKVEENTLVLFSFGPRGRIYN